MAAHRHRADFHGITFNGYFPAAWPGGISDPDNLAIVGAGAQAAFAESDIRLESADFTSVSTQDMREVRQFLEGAEPNEIFEGIRTLILRGHIHGTNPRDLETKSWSLSRAFSPMEVRRDSVASIVGTNPDEPVGVLPFNFSIDHTSVNTLPLRFYARPNVGRPLILGRAKEGLTREWAAQLVAYDSRAYNQVLQQVSLANLSGGANNIVMSGNTYVYPQIRITMAANGAATHTLRNETTGSELQFDLSSLGGDLILWIKPNRGEMTNPSGVSKYLYRKSGFLTNFFLVPGTNNITFTPATQVTSVFLWFRDAFA